MQRPIPFMTAQKQCCCARHVSLMADALSVILQQFDELGHASGCASSTDGFWCETVRPPSYTTPLAAPMALSQLHQSQWISTTAKQCKQTVAQLPRHHAVSSTQTARVQTRTAHVCQAVESQQQVQPEAAVPGMTTYLDSLRWSKDGLVPVIVQVWKFEVQLMNSLWQGKPCSRHMQQPTWVIIDMSSA